MNLKKLLTLALCLCLALSLAACGNNPAGQGSDEPTASPAPAYVKEFTQAVGGVDPDTVLFTADGMDVTADYYFYWLAYDCYNLDTNYQLYLGKALDFDELAPEGITMGQYLKEDARQVAVAYLILEREAKANNAGLTEEQKTQWEEEKAAFIEEIGQDGYEQLLHQQGMSEEMFDRIGTMNNFLLENVKSVLVPPLTEEEAEQYRTEQKIYGAKHILLLTANQSADGSVSLSTGDPAKNEDGTDFTGTAEEYNDAARAKAEELLAQINAAEDPLAKFDELMNQYSQDTGLSANPDGYTFTPDTSFVDEFKDTVYSLQPGEISGIVESSFGFHILLRTTPDVSEQYQTEKMNALMDEWANTEITPTPTYEALDAKDFYAKFTEYANQFVSSPEADSGAPTESPSESPSESPAG